MEASGSGYKKIYSEDERLQLAEKLDKELDDFINSLPRRSNTEEWPEDKWQEEMEKHPFFMKEAPKEGEELSPLTQGLQQLKYGEEYNTPEELANNYKEDGNFNFKYKKYRLAVLSYTEGIKTKCSNAEIMAQLYNNRAAAQFMLKNYRSCLNDCNVALKLKPNYSKALRRAITCCMEIKDYDKCIELCDQILEESPEDKDTLNTRTKAVAKREQARRDERKQGAREKKHEKEMNELIETIKSRNIKIELVPGKSKLDLKSVEPQIPEIVDCRVHLDGDRLVWPVMFLYPENQQSDFVRNFHEDTRMVEQLEELFQEQPPWDSEKRYVVPNLRVYFEGRNKSSIHEVDLQKSLGEVLRHKELIVTGGIPVFYVHVRNSGAEKSFLSNYNK